MEEFTAAMPKIQEWVGDIPSAESEFNLIDKNGGGQILFDEFCKWALHKHLEGDS